LHLALVGEVRFYSVIQTGVSAKRVAKTKSARLAHS
jgi:hypothetical protein